MKPLARRDKHNIEVAAFGRDDAVADPGKPEGNDHRPRLKRCKRSRGKKAADLFGSAGVFPIGGRGDDRSAQLAGESIGDPHPGHVPAGVLPSKSDEPPSRSLSN